MIRLILNAANTTVQPREGEAVSAHGRVSVYDARGEVQLYVDEIELRGTGALWQEFEQLKQRLAQEGLFDEQRKRPLPKFPRCIGIVTSRSGAVLQDIRHILERRFPLPEVLLASTAVQGIDAPPQIVAAAAARLRRRASRSALTRMARSHPNSSASLCHRNRLSA